jgi:hypothetical protein
MSRRTWKWAVVAASLVLVLLGIHLAWEQHRYRLVTSRGTISIGMTRAEVDTVLGPPQAAVFGQFSDRAWRWEVGPDGVLVFFRDGLAVCAQLHSPDRAVVTTAEAVIPRPSLVEVVRSWFTGKREE